MKPIEESLRELIKDLRDVPYQTQDRIIRKLDALLAAQAPAEDVCERCKFLEGELKAVETKAGIDNVFEQGRAQGKAAAVAAERERCAKILDDVVAEHRKNNPPHEFCEDYGCSSIEDLAAAIRATPPSESQQEPR